jgi:hypothetical protein
VRKEAVAHEAAVERVHDIIEQPQRDNVIPVSKWAGIGVVTGPRNSPFSDRPEARTGVDIPRGRW